MFKSLRVRLLLTLVIVVTVAVGTVAIFASRATTTEFRRSVSIILDFPSFSIETKINAINKYLALNKGDRSIWDGLQTLLERMSKTSRDQARIVMADLDGNVIVDSTGGLSGSVIDTDRSKPFAAFLIEGKPVLAYIVPRQDMGVNAIEARFTSSVNRSLLFAILAAGVVALLLTLLLSQSILGPVGALTSAARAMEKGDLDHRVVVKDKGELGELANAFNAMADGLGRLEQLRRNMVTDVAHELRTPLTNVRGYLEAMRDGVIQPTPEMINSLYEEAMLLNRLVDDLQELALAEAGQLNLVRRPVRVEEIIERVVYLVEAQSAEKGVQVEVDLPPNLPEIDVDAERIGQVLRNLLNNALTNTPAGGRIRVTAAMVDSQVEVCVRDNGAGISADHLPFVFERFYRADKSRQRTTGGAGLGLSIVKQLVEAHGGHVGIESQVGIGTAVTFTTPVASSCENVVRESSLP
jgi:signal transduction histidine kinase